MFGLIAPCYDLLNRLISFGQDKGWRRAAATWCGPLAEFGVLDIATGTGDQLLALARMGSPPRSLVGIDAAKDMLGRGRRKLNALRPPVRAHFSQAEAHSLPFKERSFGAVTMSFAIRNFADRLQALCEARRVLVPGGRLVVLEAGVPEKPALRLLFLVYCRYVMPNLAGLLSGQRRAYRYLCDSIFCFPRPQEFCRLLAQAGFTVLHMENLAFGAAKIFVATGAAMPDAQADGFSP
ncbi:MAG: ubiquinone/menaquinone biosynthesis methyltransferase [Calditrichaeota bacterium]|nr:ubiquinone/menaquinone biosynthesis methyltransferase [Calditrichota bacterium]